MSAASRASGRERQAEANVSAYAAETCAAQPQPPLSAAWDRLLDRPFAREPHRSTLLRAEAEAAAHTVYPPRPDWFAALCLTPPESVRAVILGQDPYHEPGQAMGLAFSVRPGVPLPPSLRNMYRELAEDLGCAPPGTGDLTSWARQGVLLLNTVLTVEAGRANSHKTLGWQAFTMEVLSAPEEKALAGASGGRPQTPVAGPRLILSSAHPSPLSAYRGFFGSRPYSKINAFLRENGVPEIRWAAALGG